MFLGSTHLDAPEGKQDVRHVFVGFELGPVFVAAHGIAVGKFGFGSDNAFAVDFPESDFLSFGTPEEFGTDIGVEDFFGTESFEGSDNLGFVDFEDFDFDF